jgi:SNF2 family DNA or RNA helicase
MKFKFCY